MFYIVIDINGNVEILRITVVKIVLRQELQCFQDFSVVTNHAPWLIGINLHVDRAAVMSA